MKSKKYFQHHIAAEEVSKSIEFFKMDESTQREFLDGKSKKEMFVSSTLGKENKMTAEIIYL